MKRTLLSAVNVHKSFRSPQPLQVLKGITLDVQEGESVAIMGKSGEGKSTLLHIFGTLEQPCQGELSLLDRKIDFSSAAEMRNRHIGFIFQSFNLLEDYTLLENVIMPARIARKETHPKSAAYERALFLLEQVGLSARRDFLAKHLSGGEKQRAAIARALLNDPELILADEPSGNLDSANSQSIHELLLSASQKYGKTVIVVTHDRELASLCDKIYMLKEGVLHPWNF